MNESPIVAQWRAEGRAEGLAEGKVEGAIKARRADTLSLLNLKFPGQVPADLIAAVEVQTDPDELARWLDTLVMASSIPEFRAGAGI